jgi:hypothetical protein
MSSRNLAQYHAALTNKEKPLNSTSHTRAINYSNALLDLKQVNDRLTVVKNRLRVISMKQLKTNTLLLSPKHND